MVRQAHPSASSRAEDPVQLPKRRLSRLEPVEDVGENRLQTLVGKRQLRVGIG